MTNSPTQRSPRIRYDRIAVIALMAGAMTWAAATTPSGEFILDAAVAQTVEPDPAAMSARGQGHTSRSSERVAPIVTAPTEAVWEIEGHETFIAALEQANAEIEAHRAAEEAAAETARRAAEAEAQAAAAAREQSRAASAPRVPAVTAVVNLSDVKQFASDLVGGGDQFACLDSLWEKESNWNSAAANRSSGAYGIPQALPGSKMASAGADWKTNPQTQVRWGVSYIEGRYGSPCDAWAHLKVKNWY